MNLVMSKDQSNLKNYYTYVNASSLNGMLIMVRKALLIGSHV